MEYREQACFGCGLCATSCPAKATVMQPRGDWKGYALADELPVVPRARGLETDCRAAEHRKDKGDLESLAEAQAAIEPYCTVPVRARRA